MGKFTKLLAFPEAPLVPGVNRRYFKSLSVRPPQVAKSSRIPIKHRRPPLPVSKVLFRSSRPHRIHARSNQADDPAQITAKSFNFPETLDDFPSMYPSARYALSTSSQASTSARPTQERTPELSNSPSSTVSRNELPDVDNNPIMKPAGSLKRTGTVLDRLVSYAFCVRW
jgi:hypothetical protein